ncbi:transketolase [Anoxybacillus rupiensis]|jgi:transketolase|uniref:Transketolase n=1 Tax=Anoxybacteroides rupiense TaxID=311460 RepID=A0ABD5IZ88_9BACL|nr:MULTISPECIES: transketolase [Anoxybacillus]MBB3906018.1 transketolase [Anoxybacillus rupiensis]MBS2772831.1 transketolase [Anoxybacillus rupiensis]MDE8563258.1 transketolase [Anoxybacillus rupiensis]MED5053654.1 transketolase [Anoxybacillus rupiensis]OQM44512.1 transketolase [Anoxybacillus sp. UARK-01]
MAQTIDQLAITTIRTLSIDAIEKANSGHPGMPMGAAPMAYTLWTKFMNHNPSNPKWFNRDRFVLSAGHGSMLLYSLLHLSGYDVSMEDIKQFRQWGSKTPGHPEYGHTPGVEATTGPLGQGIAMAVGMAMAERHLATTYNRDHFEIINHYTYAICGDGDLMEGVASEAASLAGHLKLGRLIVLYDSNDISLDGELQLSFSENVAQRFEAYGWQYLRVEDGNDIEEVAKALETARADVNRPTLIEVKTTIGYGSPNKAGTSDVHGAPLGADELKLTKEAYKWTFAEDFYVPEEVYGHFRQVVQEVGAQKEAEWNELLAAYQKAYPDLANQLKLAIDEQLPEGWEEQLPVYPEGKNIATRASSGEVLNAIAKAVPQFIGGSADLAGSNKTLIKGTGNFMPESYEGRNIWFGVREFAMGAALNGMALHGGVKVFGGTFFVFSDYLRPAIRLAALMGLPVTYVFTHDSIAVGEDGPTHEPIEQLPSLRAMPNLSLIRPADANETAAAWRLALESTDRPTALVLTRQNLPTLATTAERAYEGVKKGAYVVSEATNGEPQALLLASGSEVSLAVEAQKALASEGIYVSVISMPSWDRFEQQPEEYKEQVLPSALKKRLAIEMAASFGWERYTGDEGDILAIDRFGASAPGEQIMKEYGFTVEHVIERVKKLLHP